MLVPAIYLSGVLTVWFLLDMADRRAIPQMRAPPWRTSLWLIAAAALVLSLLYASPFGPARDLKSAIRWFVLGYPAWLLLSVIWLLPGVALSKRFALNPLRVLPALAAVIELLIGGFTHWPPTRWGATIIVGQIPVPPRYVLGFPIEAWNAYLYSLWPNTFMALVAAISFVIALRFV
jgi:hypothetical protein